ncbi:MULTISPECIES: methyltransferase family protein [Cellulosilyticum]|uniref:Isoprenylcysteine carboxyl methyltransferase n=1 Tax=Cellulosilyticum lentocellum (strain ATCC 49066 / DSM 5427 / NCIMB 11756 / RHM5) TaxID=642492 RepID=F2JPU4_CELLD|nr:MULTISPECIES: isoprenylcysteine carboxylmethyltransferase family protein [Cellulosilyticum]ADZ84879.1 Isoprenylcysteine carboxyl methyltransferase [Cellulosilyticum lentocellum DSM 5427]QEH70341.1 isoprenylcysteine carboxylmethyltransferase family protein [Cellulosilyticum sp. WCF-2]
METLESHFHLWYGVIFFILLYGIAILFVPFYKKMDRKPATAYMAFVIAFAIEMHGIPMSMYFISWLIGKRLPEGVLWGHTLVNQIGYLGMYLNIALSISGIMIIANGWYNIYHKYWAKEAGKGKVVKTGIYKYIRHPQYTGFMMITLGMLLEWATLPMLLMWPFIVWLYNRLARKEEKDMIEEFGEEYLSYMERTKRFIPFVI